MLCNYLQRVLLAGVIILLSGCAGYEPLREPESPVRLAVGPIINHSSLPQVIAPLARNLRERLAQSSRFQLVPEESAEVVLHVTVDELDRSTMARDPRDTGRPLSYLDILKVTIEWRGSPQAPWGDQPMVVEVDQLLYAQPSLIDSESAALAAMATRLADRIVQRMEWADATQ